MPPPVSSVHPGQSEAWNYHISQSGRGISITSQPCLKTGYTEARDTQKQVTESELFLSLTSQSEQRIK